MSNVKTAAVLVCAGSGSRMQGSCADKLLLEIAEKPVAVHTLCAYDQAEEIELIVVVTRKENVPIYESFADQYGIQTPVLVTIGGKTRVDSVLNGVRAVPEEYEFIAIGDGARPLVRPEDISKTIAAAVENGAAALGVKAIDTMKEISDGYITRTVPREQLIQIQTPQVFKRGEYLALAIKAQESGAEFTDDASIYEFYNQPVRFVEGHRDNLKITVPEDAALIKMLMEDRLCE
ncbi:MAG: 2-C-methyl-D-erythritol 4-phosphate cytidylyltransferase [Clostridia bacterium]|nr:2-C-methyl-D-erythritol 4-phosphate cytidylyltransferase [Clostridia bacterium]